ncbi:MAG: hypothetical protein QJR13_09600 [Bacillota bacterium]|nr:hypothetical protein [Bacillota bacterium]
MCVLCGRPRQPDDPLYCPSHRTMKRQSEWRRRNADLLLDLDEVFRQLNLPDVPQAVRRIRGGYRNARIRDAASTYRMLSQSLQQIVDELVADDPMRFIFSTLRSFIEDGPGEEIQDYPGGE